MLNRRVLKPIGLSVLFAGLVLVFSSCDGVLGPDDEAAGGDNGDGGETEAQTYAIGDTGPSGVGLVFYITDGGLHGMEVAPVDQSTGTEWISGGTTPTTVNGNTASAIGTGSANTDAIIAQVGHAASAAQISRDYRAAEEGDWFLPSIRELEAVWDNLVDDGANANGGVGGFENEWYWSSTEESDARAWMQFFFVDGDDDYAKSFSGHVRAVRAF